MNQLISLQTVEIETDMHNLVTEAEKIPARTKMQESRDRDRVQLQ